MAALIFFLLTRNLGIIMDGKGKVSQGYRYKERKNNKEASKTRDEKVKRRIIGERKGKKTRGR